MPGITVITNIALILLWIGGSIALVLGTYTLARKAMPPKPGYLDEEGNAYPASVRDMAAATGFRIAALYGIILALVYAQELHDYQDVRAGLSREAVAVAQVYHDAARYGGPDSDRIKLEIAAYTRTVVEQEWAKLSKEQRLSPQAWGQHNAALDVVLDLQAANPREEALRQRMLANLHKISDLRQYREEQAANNVALVFWLPAIAGMVMVSIPFFAFPARRETFVLLASFGAFAGLILFFIDAFSNPFSEPFRVQPRAFERLLETDIGKTQAAAPMPAMGGVSG